MRSGWICKRPRLLFYNVSILFLHQCGSHGGISCTLSCILLTLSLSVSSIAFLPCCCCCRFDCVYPTRTARFGVALVPTGSLRLKARQYCADTAPVDETCGCSTCVNYSRAALHIMFKENNPLASQLLTKHNLAYMMTLMRTMRQVRHLVMS